MFTVSKYHVIYSPNGVPYIWDKMFTKCLYLRFFEFEFEDWHSRYFYLKNTLKNNEKKVKDEPQDALICHVREV